MLFKKNAQPSPSALVTPTEQDYVFSEDQQKTFDSLEADSNGMVPLGDLCLYILGEQTQYVSYHFVGIGDSYPVLVEGLRFDASSPSYHSYRIHKEDAPEFIARLRAYRHSTGRTCN